MLLAERDQRMLVVEQSGRGRATMLFWTGQAEGVVRVDQTIDGLTRITFHSGADLIILTLSNEQRDQLLIDLLPLEEQAR